MISRIWKFFQVFMFQKSQSDHCKKSHLNEYISIDLAFCSINFKEVGNSNPSFHMSLKKNEISKINYVNSY